MLVPDDYNDVHRAVLRALAVQVIATLDPQHSMEQLIKNPVTLHSYVSKMRVNWPSIAKDLGMTRASVYHWYNETHLRRISGIKMSAEDKKIIKDAIIQGIETQTILEDGFQLTIRNLFESKYPRQEIMMTYNNMLRSRDIQRILSRKKITLPTKRHAVSIISKTRQPLTDQKPTLAALATDGTANSTDQLATSSFTQQPPFSSSQVVSQPAFPVGLSAFPPPVTATAATAATTTAGTPSPPGQGPVVPTAWQQLSLQAPVAGPGFLNHQPVPYQWLMYWLPTAAAGQPIMGMPPGTGFSQPYQAVMFPQVDQDASSVYKS
ncbi:Hypothetical protein GLP15_3061 [Giardia lamblia P15]|uniref:Uncharacterized protein n=1 Tax=Giardia intestinalis (strain P15) TaxID=658858 RepID=E1F938_GIAIA|nr:Hypothetical protein GLP15_3061 [Giardia lamblia P15]